MYVPVMYVGYLPEKIKPRSVDRITFVVCFDLL